MAKFKVLVTLQTLIISFLITSISFAGSTNPPGFDQEKSMKGQGFNKGKAADKSFKSLIKKLALEM